MDRSAAAPQMSPLAARLFALPFLGAGAVMVGLGLGWVPVDPSRVHAPGWVIVLAGIVFLCGGGAVLAASFGAERTAGRWFGIPIVLAMAAILHWVAFGEGERKFTASTSVNGSVVDARPVAETQGRFVFGAFAVLIDLALVAGTVRWWRRRRPT